MIDMNEEPDELLAEAHKQYTTLRRLSLRKVHLFLDDVASPRF